MSTSHTEVDWLKRWSGYAPERVAIYDAEHERSFTYREFYRLANRAAHAIRTRYQIQPGDRVAVLATNEVEYFFLFFGLQRLGAIMVPINFRLTAREIEHVIQDSGARLLIAQSSLSEQIQSLAIEKWNFDGPGSLTEWLYDTTSSPMIEMKAGFEDVCMILYTSGTTGKPKGALITHQILFWNSVNTSLRLNISEDDVTVSFLPFFHTSGWNVLNTPFFHRGAQIVFIRKFDPERILTLCETQHVTILFGVPTTMEMLRQHPRFERVNLASIRYAIVGGEPMPSDLIRLWQARGIPIRQGYGLTEFGPNVFSLNQEDSIRKIGSIGFPNFYVEAKVVDQHGEELGPEQVGELALRGPMCTPGYWQNPKATAETIREGWLYTGDLVRRDEENYFYVVGRKKDMYISGGENVYPTEVEQFLRSHRAVAEVAVVGVPDEKWGEVGRAFVVRAPGEALSESELLDFCSGQLAKFKTPKYVTFMNELPKGDSGKILKRKLAEPNVSI